MPPSDLPMRPADAYKAIIDELVDDVRPSMGARLVVESSNASNAPADRKYDPFIESLSPPQRVLLAEMLSRERDGAIHDVLARLTWWILARNVGLSYRGEPMPVDLSGMGLHGDYVGRVQGWEWPSDAEDDESMQ